MVDGLVGDATWKSLGYNLAVPTATKTVNDLSTAKPILPDNGNNSSGGGISGIVIGGSNNGNNNSKITKPKDAPPYNAPPPNMEDMAKYFPPVVCYDKVYGLGISSIAALKQGISLAVIYVWDTKGNFGLLISMGYGVELGANASAGVSFLFGYSNSIYDLGMAINVDYSSIEAIKAAIGFTAGGSVSPLPFLGVGADIIMNSYGQDVAVMFTIGPTIKIPFPIEGHIMLTLNLLIPFNSRQ